MGSDKLYIRNILVEKKKQFAQTNKNKYVIEAAVLKGVYCGLGGTKIIPLPNYCSSIVNVVASIVKSKSRFRGNAVKDLDKLVYHLIKNNDSMLAMNLDITGDKPRVQLDFKHLVNPVVINIVLPLTNKGIADMATTVIGNTSIKYKFDEEELGTIKDTTEIYLYYMDRRF